MKTDTSLRIHNQQLIDNLARLDSSPAKGTKSLTSLHRTLAAPAFQNIGQFARGVLQQQQDARLAQNGGITAPGQKTPTSVVNAAANPEKTKAVHHFFDGYKIPVNGPNGPIQVPIAYRKPHKEKIHGKEVLDSKRYAQDLTKELGGKNAPEAHLVDVVVSGRATPTQLRRVTTALAKQHPEKFADAGTAHDYLTSLGIGVDSVGCAHAALKNLGTLPPNALESAGTETLTHLSKNPNFIRRNSPAEAQVGDVIVLKPSGHYGYASVVGKREEKFGSAFLGNRDYDASKIDLKPGDSLVVYETHGAFGPGTDVGSKTWMYNTRTGRWATMPKPGDKDRTIVPSSSKGPNEHELEGVYRPKYAP